MALRYGYFDSEITGFDEDGMPVFDRAESSDFMAYIYSNFFSNGVLIGVDELKVIPYDGMYVTIEPGMALINGRSVYSESGEVLMIANPDSTYTRLDRVVLRLDLPNRQIEAVIKEGTPSASPVAPSLTRTDDIHEISLATITVATGTTEITSSMITDDRDDEDICGRVRLLGKVGDGLTTISSYPEQAGTLTYTGSSLEPIWRYYNSEELTIDGDTSGTNAGTYTVSFTPREGYKWPDGTRGAKYVDWTISKATLALPTVSGSLSYNGATQTVNLNNYDSTKMSVSGNTGVNAGSYTATVTITNNNYVFTNGNTTVSLAWAIAKGNPGLTLSASSVSLNSEAPTATISASFAAGLSVSFSLPSSDYAYISAQTSNSVTAHVGASVARGSVQLTATIAATSNYNGATATCTITKTDGILVGTWADASDEAIAEMIAAADNLEIKLSDFWSVGDVRRVRISATESVTGVNAVVAAQPAQDIDLVLMHYVGDESDDNYPLTTPIVGSIGTKTHPEFIVGVRNCLQNQSAMGYHTIKHTASNTERLVWNEIMGADSTLADLLTWLDDNSGFYGALPSSIKNILKEVNLYCPNVPSYDYPMPTMDSVSAPAAGSYSCKVTLPSLKELNFDNTIKSLSWGSYKSFTYGDYQAGQFGYSEKGTDNKIKSNNEGIHLDYFADTDNLLKGKGVSGSNISYFTRTTELICSASSGASYYGYGSGCAPYVAADGSIGAVSASESDLAATKGITPMFFI